jgi:hypothetical protein
MLSVLLMRGWLLRRPECLVEKSSPCSLATLATMSEPTTGTSRFGAVHEARSDPVWQDELAAFDKKDQTPEINRRLTLRNTDGSSQVRGRPSSCLRSFPSGMQSKLRNTPRVVMYDLSGELCMVGVGARLTFLHGLSGALGSMHSGGSAGVAKDSEAEAASALW